MGKGKPKGGFPSNLSMKRHREGGKTRKPPGVLWHVQRLLESLNMKCPENNMYGSIDELMKAEKKGGQAR